MRALFFPLSIFLAVAVATSTPKRDSSITCEAFPYVDLQLVSSGKTDAFQIPLFNNEQKVMVEDNNCLHAKYGNILTKEQSMPESFSSVTLLEDKGVFVNTKCRTQRLKDFVSYYSKKLSEANQDPITTVDDLMHRDIIRCLVQIQDTSDDGKSGQGEIGYLLLGKKDKYSWSFKDEKKAISYVCCVDYGKDSCGFGNKLIREPKNVE